MDDVTVPEVAEAPVSETCEAVCEAVCEAPAVEAVAETVAEVAPVDAEMAAAT